MRDTQNKELGHLSFTYAEWNAFIETTLSTTADNPLRDGIAILRVERGPLDDPASEQEDRHRRC